MKGKTPAVVIEATSVSAISPDTMEYFRIGKAAEKLSAIELISADDLLHMGTSGNAEIVAPVVSEGTYEWPEGFLLAAFPELSEPFRRKFDSSDRVILLKDDLDHMEAVGWAIPNAFRAPFTAREVIQYLQFCMPIPPWKNSELTSPVDADKAQQLVDLLKAQPFEVSDPDIEAVTISKYQGNSEEALSLNKREVIQEAIKYASKGRAKHLDDDDVILLRKLAFHAPWHAVEPSKDNSERTTIDHLFIAAKEVERIQNDLKSKKYEMELTQAKLDATSSSMPDKHNKPNDLKWTDARLMELLVEYKSGMTQEALGKKYGVSRQQISALLIRAKDILQRQSKSYALFNRPEIFVDGKPKRR